MIRAVQGLLLLGMKLQIIVVVFPHCLLYFLEFIFTILYDNVTDVVRRANEFVRLPATFAVICTHIKGRNIVPMSDQVVDSDVNELNVQL